MTEQTVEAEVIRQLGQGNYAEACRILDQHYPRNTRDVTALFLRARCKMGLKAYKEAIADYESLVTISPDSLRAKQELIEARVSLGGQKKSKSCLPAANQGFCMTAILIPGPNLIW